MYLFLFSFFVYLISYVVINGIRILYQSPRFIRPQFFKGIFPLSSVRPSSSLPRLSLSDSRFVKNENPKK
ncbi:hypothetical protein EBV26_19180 [bacterium]|nr:hypothetical protein [bacterium]